MSGPRRLLYVSMALVLTIILSLPIAGIFGIVQNSEAADEETVLRVGFFQRIDNLNPMAGLSDAAYVFYGLVYDSFSTVENDFDIVGNLATDHRVVSQAELDELGDDQIEGSVWEYTISTNATWHDGEPFTVEDAVWWINLQADEQYYEMMWAYQPYAYFMHHAEAIDDKTIWIHYYDRGLKDVMDFPESSIPCSYPYLVCIPMLPKHRLEDMNPRSLAFTWQGVFDPGEDGPPIIGTGPFMATENIYDEWVRGDHITLERNPNYHWGVERNMLVQFDKIVMYFYDEAYALSTALENGQLDIAALPAQTYNALKNNVNDGSVSNVHCQDGLKCTQYWTEIGFSMDDESGPNKARLDPSVRKALAMAIDKNAIVNTYYAGLAEPGTTLISSVNDEWHYEPTAEELIPFDIDDANQLLEDAGYRDTNGDSVREVTADSMTAQENWESVGKALVFEMLIRQEYPEEKEIADYLTEQWAKIGVTLTYDIYDEVTFSSIVYSYDYDSMIWYWSADADPNFMLFCQAAQSIGGWSDNMYNNPDYQENYLLSIKEMDPVQRKVYTDNCQRIAYEDCAYILLAYAYQTYAWRTDTFEGWGDWDANPCLSFDHFWTGPQLMFELTPTGTVSDDGEPPWAIIAGVLIAVVAIVAVVVVLKMKGGKKGEAEDGGSPLGE